MKIIHFLAGLPRSGSTVLAAILNQHPSMHVTATSGLIDLMGAAVQVWEQNPSMKTQGQSKDEIFTVLRALSDAKYSNVEKPVVVDKSRGWPAPQIMATMREVMGRNAKIIATVRPVPDCAASFVRVVKPENVARFLRTSQMIEHLKSSYMTLKDGYAAAPENFLLIDYDELLADPRAQLDRVLAFLEFPSYEFDLANIDGSVVAEKDEEVWSVKGLHDIKPTLGRQHTQAAQDVLGDAYDGFCQPKFWVGETTENRTKQPIDLQLEAGQRGDFKLGWEIAQQIEREKPTCNRAAYNRGFYLLRQGDLQGGMALLTRGRIENVFGNRRPQTPRDIWEGQSNCTVLLNLEGGLGDQIHGVRYAREIAQRGCKVIVACSGELIPLVKEVYGVTLAVQHDVVHGVYHDYWLPSMSAVCVSGYGYEGVSGAPYIGNGLKPDNERMKIGLRWQGNPRFEHEQHRIFPPSLLFDAVQGVDAEFICLQRDIAVDQRPVWCKEVPISTWGETKDAIASCDLVISSCTSVAHLAGAMGVPTWIVSPVMPYYLWADGKPTSVWYDSVRLFRQEVFGEWAAPFNNIRGALALQDRRAA